MIRPIIAAVDLHYPTYAEALRGETEQRLENARLSAAGVDVSTRAVAVTASPAAAIQQLAEASDAAMIVVGSSDRGHAGRVQPGAVTDRLLQGAPCPVAVATKDYAGEELRLIGAAFVGRDDARAALAYACDLAQAADALVRVLTVREPSDPRFSTVLDPDALANVERTRAEAAETVTAGEPTGKRVLVVGAGPSGLSAAYHLRRLGHAVTIYDAGPSAGGMMRFGIPRYRLPRDVLDAEIQRILDMGVELELNRTVTDLEAEMDGFDAVFLAVGAHIGKRAYIPAGSAAKVLDAVSVLRSMEGEAPRLGRRVVVYGGGNTAVDAARTAKRLGAEEAIVVYRRTRDRMPAHDFEVEEALEEGVLVKWLSTIKRADEGRLVLERMELDESGFPQGTGELEELEADSLILALGQETDLSLLDGVEGIELADGVVQVDERTMTGRPGVFAGGDMVPAERTVTVGIGHGKQAARCVDSWLRGAQHEHAPRPGVVEFEELNPWYYSDAPRTVRPRLEAVRRRSTFDEVVGGLDESTAKFEARRCLSCGNCFACDNCFGVCPDNAVIKLDDPGPYRYEIDLDFCKGCGLCAAECPAGAIEMVAEAI